VVVNGDCLSSCAYDASNPCCGCCDNSTQTCHQIPEFATCCDPGEAFCGCLSFRAFCQGIVWGGSSASPFGTCYPTANLPSYSCGYMPAPNAWILCSIDQPVPCFASSFATPVCCGNDDTCTYNAATNLNECIAPVVCGGQTCLPGDGCCNTATPVCYNTTDTDCTTIPTGGNFLCPKGDLSCPVAAGVGCYDPSTSECAQNAAGAYYICPSGNQVCNDGCYDPSVYACAADGQGGYALCPAAAPLKCGQACYSSSSYCCSNGSLAPAGTC